MLERYFGRRNSVVIPELGFKVVEGRPALNSELISRKSWLTNWIVSAINENPLLRPSLVENFPQVKDIHIETFLDKLQNEGIKVRDYITDYSVSNNQLYHSEKAWLQQTFKTTHLGDPMVRLIPDVEEVVEDLEESKKKGRLILSPAGLMVYEFSAFTKDQEYSGVFTQTCFISVYELHRKKGVTTLLTTLRGGLNRYYDERSIKQLHDYRIKMAKRKRTAISSNQNMQEFTSHPRFKE